MSLHHIAQQLRTGQTTSKALTQASLAAISQHNKRLNVFISVDEAGALEQAQACDAKGYDDAPSALFGVPMAVKDVFMQQGIRTSCASAFLKDFIAPFDSTVIQRLKAAGAVIVGKTNMDEFAMGSTNSHSHFGACIHPFNPDISPGGSSGGSAVAVASGMTPVAIGTDTGGSVRQPAALCGVVGMKPTYGRISRYGMVAYASSLDQCGIFGRTAGDCATVLQALAGQDKLDATSGNAPVDNYTPTPGTCTGLKIGIAKEFWGTSLDSSIRQAMEHSLELYKNLGAQVLDISIPHFPQAVASYYVTATAEASSNLGRFDGVRYGQRASKADRLDEIYTHSRSQGFGSEVQRRIMLGVFVLSSGYYDAYYLKAQKIRRLLAEDFATAFTKVDCIMSPVTPSPRMSAHLDEDDPTREYLADLYTVPVNMAGLPAISFPCYQVNQPHLAYGYACQLIGPPWSEASLLNAVASYECSVATDSD